MTAAARRALIEAPIDIRTHGRSTTWAGAPKSAVLPREGRRVRRRYSEGLFDENDFELQQFIANYSGGRE